MNSIKNHEKMDILKISWIRSSIILGLILLAIGIAAIFILKIVDTSNMQVFSDAKNFVEGYGLLGIFITTLIAGTIIPLGSPALVVAAASFGINPLLLALVATVGFTIGISINYFLAYHLGRPYIMKKMGAEKMEEATLLWSRWGWILYFLFGVIPFLPVEFLALICGLLKTRIETFLILSFIPRLLVFFILAYFGETVGNWIGLI
ncbi:MAG: VTT domain-containing protein [Candidatus Bathyarchaeota archaeon]|jgi:membrane protein YqaA with SNARE-associated domain|nr:VTT domain-containing protein [Candidatus Bathyarchaeota archaeon]